MPSIYNPSPAPSPDIPMVAPIVEIRQNWGDDWIFVPYLEAVSARRTVAPVIGHARLRYRAGNIKREDSLAQLQYDPNDVRDWYVRISIQQPGSAPVPVWVGVIEEELISYLQLDIPAGDEIFTAYELFHLMDRQVINRSYVIKADNNTYKLDWAVPFNERPVLGTSVIGNRSGSPVNVGGVVYAFASDRDHSQWSNLNVVNYLLAGFVTPPPPTGLGLKFNLIGQTAPLDQMVGFHKFEGKTVWEAMCKLIDIHRGMTFRCMVDDQDNIYMVVVTTSDTPITVAGKTLPANQQQISLTLPTDAPYTHLIDEIPLRITSSTTFTTIKVNSSRIRMLCPFSWNNNNLNKGWGINEETNYDTAYDPSTQTNNGTDPTQNDQIRDQFIYENVYKRLIVPEEWDGTIPDSQGNNNNVMPIPLSDGSVSLDTSKIKTGQHPGIPDFWLHDRTFDRQTHLRKGVDYTQVPPLDNNPPQVEREFIEFIGLVYDNVDGSNHAADNKWHPLDKLNNQSQGTLHDIHLSHCDKNLGVKLHSPFNHYFANGVFGGAAVSNNFPELSWRQVLIVGEFATDKRMHVTWHNSIDNGRRKEVNVEAARYVYVVPNCPITTDKNGQLVNMPEKNRIIHNDLPIIQQVLAELVAYYGVPRQATHLTIKIPMYVCDVGSMLTSINTSFSTESIRTLITAIEMDFDKQTTVVETGFEELDYVALVGRSDDLHDGEESYLGE